MLDVSEINTLQKRTLPFESAEEKKESAVFIRIDERTAIAQSSHI